MSELVVVEQLPSIHFNEVQRIRILLYPGRTILSIAGSLQDGFGPINILGHFNASLFCEYVWASGYLSSKCFVFLITIRHAQQ